MPQAFTKNLPPLKLDRHHHSEAEMLTATVRVLFLAPGRLVVELCPSGARKRAI